MFGYTNLFGCDIEINDEEISKYFPTGLEITRQNLTKTSYASCYFDIITSCSVIEHGVNLHLYFSEMSRLLKPGGVLLTSCDYWETPVVDARIILSFVPIVFLLK